MPYFSCALRLHHSLFKTELVQGREARSASGCRHPAGSRLRAPVAGGLVVQQHLDHVALTSSDPQIMEQLLSVMAIFIQYPLLAAVLGVILLVLGQQIRRPTPVLAGIVWLLYALYETGMKRRWLCTGECNIRIDLLLIFPVLALSLVAVAASLVWPRSTPRPPA